MKYVAFLRGINVGGNAKVSMDELKEVFSELGFRDVKTILNSGNVIFSSDEKNDLTIQQKIDKVVEQKFGRPIRNLVRSLSEIEQLIEADPFKGIEVTKDTRLYVTFLSEKHSMLKPDLAKIISEGVSITRVTEKEVCSVIIITPEKNTTDLMGFIEKVFGKNVTTRNWNTILKVVKI
ncbi:DUF1697 domain-containing protein [soil metagenome]